MMRPRLILGLLLAVMMPASASAKAKPAAPVARATGGANWNGVVTVTPLGSRVLGNPQASVKLTEYVSYTCPHCAHFEVASAAQLKLVFIAGGKGSIEVRHVLRDPVDLAIALITNCVEPRRFFQIHEAFMRGQDDWEALLPKLGEGAQKHWYDGDKGSRMRAIASDLRFYPIAERFGLSRPAADRCLSDQGLMDRLANQTREATAAGVDATPSFAINGALLAGTHDWTTLGPQLAARM
jgi:protein-disulfide isomerase